MDSTRQNKVARLLQKEIAEILQQKSSTIFPGSLITVTVVRVSPDMQVAKVFLSIFPARKEGDELDTIRTHTKEIRHILGSRIRHQVKKIPELAFFIDDSLDYADRIEELLKPE